MSHPRQIKDLPANTPAQIAQIERLKARKVAYAKLSEEQQDRSPPVFDTLWCGHPLSDQAFDENKVPICVTCSNPKSSPK